MADPRMQIIVKAFKEIGEFLGGKLDSNLNAQTTKLNEIVKQIEILQTKEPNLSPLVDELANILNGFASPEQSNDMVVSAIESLKKDFKKAVESIKIPPQDNKDIIKELKSLKTIKFPTIPDYSKEFKSLEKEIKSLNKEVKFPKEFTLAKQQLNQLVGSMGGAPYSGPLPARSTIITRLSAPTANTEYSHTFSKSCVKFRLKLASQNTSFFYSWKTGTLPQSGDGSKYITIPANWLDSQDAEYGGKIIYVEHGSGTAQTFEIEEGIA